MDYQSDKHHRQSIRLRHYDYSSPGAYFVTLCTHVRQHLFGRIDKGQMVLNDCGHIAHNEWLKTPNVRPNVVLDAFVVMPNHLHMVFWIEPRRGVLQYALRLTCNTPLR